MSARRILITGASSGIGEALAVRYAERYGAELTLGLVARRTERLDALAQRLGARGTRVLTYGADVRERERMAELARDFVAAAGGIDLAIANAGVSHGDRLRNGDAAPLAETMNVNVIGTLHTLLPLIPTMIAQQSGHLVSIGSVAGFVALSGKGAYCASKAAVKLLMDAWRQNLRRHGVRVSTICPGWVVSELTASNPYPMPFMVDTPKAARLIARAIERGRATYVFPWQMRLLLPLARAWPQRLLPTFGTRS